MSSTTSPNMGLTIPAVSNQPGPQYAVDINASLAVIDSHNHSSGEGVQITPDGLDISSDLDFGGNNATGLRSTRFTSQGAVLTLADDLNCLYTVAVDLYYNDGNGNNVRITQGGGVTGAPGSITNLNPPASASYNSGSSTFIWQSGVNIPANMDFASAIFRNLSAGSNGVTVQASASLASNYSLTLPLLPASQKFMTLDAAGVMSAPWAVDGSTIVVASNVVKVPAQGITATQIEDHSIDLLELATTVLQWNVNSLVITTPSFNVRVATTANGTLATAFDNGSPIDGVTLATNDLILIKNQTTTTDNGVYVVQASGAPVRSTSYDTFTELNYAGVHVTAGTVNTNTNWFQNNVLTSLSDAQSWSNSSTQAFVVPENVNRLFAKISGGGGGGGGGVGSSAAGGGGAGGNGSQPFIMSLAVTPGETIPITVGSGGKGAASSSGAGATGTTGGTSSILGSLARITVLGAAGGVGGVTTSGGAAGTTSVAPQLVSIAGGSGSASGTAGGTGSNSLTANGGTGGAIAGSSGPGGGGGAGGSNGGTGGSGVSGVNGVTGVAGTNGSGGGGGSGGTNAATGNGGPGGKGGDAIVEIIWLGAPS